MAEPQDRLAPTLMVRPSVYGTADRRQMLARPQPAVQFDPATTAKADADPRIV